MSTRQFVLALCAGAAFGAPAYAHAAITELAADISQFQYQLIDLDPNDGITPAITFTGSAASAFSYTGGGGTPTQYSPIENVGVTELSTPSSTARASVGPTAVSARVSAGPGAVPWQFADAESTYRYQFTLTPNTGLAISALGALSIKTPVDEMSNVTIALTGQLTDPAAPWDDQSLFSASYQITRGTGQLDTASFNLSGYLYTDNRVRSGNLELYADAGTTVISAVPEPGSYAMLLAGALLIGARVRKPGSASPSPAQPS